MSRQIMQKALHAFEVIMFEKDVDSCKIIAKNARYALREELAKPDHGFDRTASHIAVEYVDTAQPEQNFCQRCGKRLGDGIHTCTHPEQDTWKPEICHCESIQRCTMFDRCMKNEKN